MAMAGANPFAIQKAMGHKDIKTTMIYVDIAKPHIQEQMEKLNRIPVPPSFPRMKALPSPANIN
jgi:integrase